MSDKAKTKPTCLICNCERTMALDGATISAALGREAPLKVHSHLCRTEVASFEASLEGSDNLLVACTQEAPLFSEIAEDAAFAGSLSTVNIRETAGWASDGDANPKVAALLAAASVPITPTGQKTITSNGVCLVYGAGQAALEAAKKLAGRLSVTLLLTDAEDLIPPDFADIPIALGRISAASGHLGAFRITVDGYAPLSPSSRATPDFVMARDGATSECDIIVDLSGGAPLFVGADKRDGYLRADPGYPTGIAEALWQASDLVGEFEKPIYVAYDPDICAHSRSEQVGCSKCLDTCPAGAIAPEGDIVVYDTGICGGCGGCVAVCPSGAVSYAFPRAGDLIARVQTTLEVYTRAGGETPMVLFHDDRHGTPLIGAMARFGRGLPVNVIPFAVHSVTALGHDVLASVFAAGASRIAVLAPPDRAEEMAALQAETVLTSAILDGLGLHGSRFDIIDDPDPDAVEARLHDLADAPPLPASAFVPTGPKREIARAAIQKLRDAAEAPPDVIALPEAAPYGRISIDTDGCTLCLACVSSCPVDALLDMADKPGVRFVEAACVQCGLCRTTCPESVISLEPRLNMAPSALSPVTLNEDEPFHCVECGKPFGTKATIERISAQLAGRHSMFQKEGAERVIQMCDDCRIAWQANQADNPFAAGPRPRVRTTADYLAARDGSLSADDFLDD